MPPKKAAKKGKDDGADEPVAFPGMDVVLNSFDTFALTAKVQRL